MISEIDTKESNANDVAAVNEENQNSLDTCDEDSQLNTVRDLIVELKDMYNEFLLQIKLVQKDLIRSAKYEELESKVLIEFFSKLFSSLVRATVDNEISLDWLTRSNFSHSL